MIYSQVTEDIKIEVKVAYVPEAKRPPINSAHFWAYYITITNLRADKVQLLTRHWDIIDDLGDREIVDGDGVIGEQPVIEPGEAFSYSSACPLDTPSGSMGGFYGFTTVSGDKFKVVIPTFSLHLPSANRSLN